MNKNRDSLNMSWKLMTDDAITLKERETLAHFICTSSKLTQGEVVSEFEKAWSRWLGCKYSVYVNSGSSANLLITRALANIDDKSTWISQACTWATTVAPIMQFAKLQLCDINLDNFGPDLENLEHIFKTQKPRFIFLTHLLGFSALSDELIKLCSDYDVTIVEDCCEAHGACFKGQKVGTFGIASSFSFYYGHHMTTIEGGMICTHDEGLYHELLLLRSHGLLRTLPGDERRRREDPKVDPLFTFLRDGFNVRNTDIHAKLGLLQLPNLDKFIEHRNENLKTFLDGLDPGLYKTDFNREGCSNFALPIFTKKNNIKDIKRQLQEINVEYRPCVAGNLFEQPFMKSVDQEKYDKNVKILHNSCIYIGNHKDVTPAMIRELCRILNSL